MQAGSTFGDSSEIYPESRNRNTVVALSDLHICYINTANHFNKIVEPLMRKNRFVFESFPLPLQMGNKKKQTLQQIANLFYELEFRN